MSSLYDLFLKTIVSTGRGYLTIETSENEGKEKTEYFRQEVEYMLR